jgi:hypothetical protein
LSFERKTSVPLPFSPRQGASHPQGPVQLVVDPLLAIRADESPWLDLAVQVESFADTAGHLRLAGIFRAKGLM